MTRALRTSLLPVAFVLAVVAAACAEPPAPTIDVGSGLRFLPQVADPLNDAGRYPSVVANADGLPVVAYFGFEEELDKGEVAAPRPVGSPSIPGVFLATASPEGFWTRGAIAIAEQIPAVTIAFNPAIEPSVADLTPNNVTGLSMVADGDTYHAVWGSADGLYYATGSLDPAGTTAAEATQVTTTPGVGPSIGLVGGEPWIAFYTSTSTDATVQLATPSGDAWIEDTIAETAGCTTCQTAVIDAAGGPTVAYSDGGNGVQAATNDGENGWVSVDIESGDGIGEGLAGVPTQDGFAISYYAGAQVTLATQDAQGGVQTTSVAEVPSGSAAADGARTSLSVGSNGAFDVAWVDAEEGVRFATGQADSLETVDTGTATTDAAYPSVSITEDGSVTYLAWYAPEEQDLLVGGYGEFRDVPFAAVSPAPTGRVSPPSTPSDECTPVANGTVTVVAEGIAFTDGSCIEAPAGEPFTIEFDNRDQGTDHNVQIFTGEEASGDTVFEGEIVTGPTTVQYDVQALDPGTHAFNCIVHPTMLGEVRAVEGGGGGEQGDTGGQTGGGGETGGDGETGGGGGGGGAVTVTAANLAFDTSTIELAADQPNTINFVNEDQGVQHNISIFPSADDLANALFRGDLITGPDEIDYTVDPLEAGEYYFHCDVHPDMNGSVSVS